ncbi:PTS system mannose/fructose/N-acetylgalactosamine-transporter subunit IIB [Clostridium frigidicarnis]|uniref:PTS system, mannose-specific IIB component n=1 Tax=Clostridium frigidicarnis TaxID=84698 RepID=A0A1I0YEB9_9CLOT|nr:PTS sugar transporter subunit IIB [Clostridium frigidicarnis]SFB10850.1 PTS system, mannose-specific IIB component [Clostridium frigidicarnis]
MKGIVHIRIDDRLIHGQVAAFWTNALGITRIMVVNDQVAVDEMQKSLLRMVAPASVRTSIINKETAVKNILADKYEGQRVLMILKNPKDVWELREAGLEINEFNVGNMASREGTRSIKRSVNVNDEDTKYFNTLLEAGVDINAVMVPDDKNCKLKDIL